MISKYKVEKEVCLGVGMSFGLFVAVFLFLFFIVKVKGVL